jgi:hypothetical protein
MGFAEISNIDTMTAIRIDDGVVTKAPLKMCDAHGTYRTPFDGVQITEDLWFCHSCYAAYRAQLTPAIIDALE